MAKKDPKTAVKGLILFRGKYLLLLRSDKENIDPSMWDMPGGGIEKGETERQALIREIKEEIGIDISSCKIFPIKNWTLKKSGIKLGGTDFLCILENCQKIKIKLSPEHIRAKWLSEKEIMGNEELPIWFKESVVAAVAKLKKL